MALFPIILEREPVKDDQWPIPSEFSDHLMAVIEEPEQEKEMHHSAGEPWPETMSAEKPNHTKSTGRLFSRMDGRLCALANEIWSQWE